MNEMYIQRQPSHILLSIIKVPKNFEVSNVVHEALFELEKVSDIIFLFPDKISLSKKKFTSLYQGCGWTSYNNLPESFINVLRYDKEIFDGHTGTLYSNLEDLEMITTISEISRLPLILGSTIVSAVFEISRLKAEEFKEIYELKEPTKLSEILMMWIYGQINDTSGMYCIYKSSSPIMLFPKPLLINQLLEGATKEYLETFKDFDLRYLLASLSMKVGIRVLNKNFNELGI